MLGTYTWIVTYTLTQFDDYTKTGTSTLSNSLSLTLEVTGQCQVDALILTPTPAFTLVEYYLSDSSFNFGFHTLE